MGCRPFARLPANLCYACAVTLAARSSTALALAFALAACTASEGAGTTDDAIVGGRRETGYPAVGVVHMVTSRSFCSGTLVAPDIVLTAAHCAEGGEQIDAFYTGAGKASPDETVDPGMLGMKRHEVAEVALYPGYEYFLYCPNPAADVALVRLVHVIADIEPTELGVSPRAGASCRAVGFGQHDADAGTPTFLEKRSGSVKIADVRDGSFDVKAGSGLTSHGDSGGPLFCAGTIVGVTSCLPDFPLDAVTYVSVSSIRSWIEETSRKWRDRALDGGVADH